MKKSFEILKNGDKKSLKSEKIFQNWRKMKIPARRVGKGDDSFLLVKWGFPARSFCGSSCEDFRGSSCEDFLWGVLGILYGTWVFIALILTNKERRQIFEQNFTSGAAHVQRYGKV